ncbi:MAG: lysophospholipid acyltransferase family protein [Anaerolineales bacterium]
MPQDEYQLAYPRKRIARSLGRGLGRLLLPVLFRIKIEGKQNFPRKGPLLVVGNHTAAMEAVMMAVYTPWQVEMLGAGDIPQERIIEVVTGFYGSIPIRRGSFDRQALVKATGVLKQEGVVGLFPEGGVWSAGDMRPQTGVAWLSYRTGAPVLPINFSGTTGALAQALRFRRPSLSMIVGQPIPAARLPEDKPRKVYLQEYASQVIQAIDALLSEQKKTKQEAVGNESFRLDLYFQGPDGNRVTPPEELSLHHAQALAKLLHQPRILKIFDFNLRLPVSALVNVADHHEPGEIITALNTVLHYLQKENPYLLTYRFGPKEGEQMRMGLEELREVALWAQEHNLQIYLYPERRYYSVSQRKEIVQTEQGRFEEWM